MGVTVFGIRHHGPGCARSLRTALEELRPDVVVLEGPPEAEQLLSWVAHEGLKPPVALLVYPVDEPRRAVYFPLAVFSPEWQALSWAASNTSGRTVHGSSAVAPARHREGRGRRRNQRQESADDQAGEAAECEEPQTPPDARPGGSIRWRKWPRPPDYKDHELWWENQVERRSDATEVFAAILEAMSGVRAVFPEIETRDLLREAHMRKTLRAVVKEGFANIAVVCGAWHAPVLDAEALAGKRSGCKIKEDTERLSGLPRVKTTATLIPWTYSRLTYHSGYGAGVQSPGWYAHIWNSNDEAPTRLADDSGPLAACQRPGRLVGQRH